MRLLLDTHVLIWWLAEDERLSKRIRKQIINPENIVFVSAISACEIAIKKSLGKLSVPDDLEIQIEQQSFEVLPITIKHGLYLEKLPFHHKDPFDRILIAQAKIDSLTIVSYDRKFSLYEGLSILP